MTCTVLLAVFDHPRLALSGPCWSPVVLGEDWLWLLQGPPLLCPGVVAERILGVCRQHLGLVELFVWSGGPFSTAAYKVVQCPNMPLPLSLCEGPWG